MVQMVHGRSRIVSGISGRWRDDCNSPCGSSLDPTYISLSPIYLCILLLSLCTIRESTAKMRASTALISLLPLVSAFKFPRVTPQSALSTVDGLLHPGHSHDSAATTLTYANDITLSNIPGDEHVVLTSAHHPVSVDLVRPPSIKMAQLDRILAPRDRLEPNVILSSYFHNLPHTLTIRTTG